MHLIAQIEIILKNNSFSSFGNLVEKSQNQTLTRIYKDLTRIMRNAHFLWSYNDLLLLLTDLTLLQNVRWKKVKSDIYWRLKNISKYVTD